MNKIILLADDDNDDFEIFKEALAKVNCDATLFHAVNGVAVLNYLNTTTNERPDVIILDLNMPVMNGWQTLARLKSTQAFEDIPVIIYTTSAHVRDIEIANDLKAHGFITKPSNPNILIKVIDRIICSLGTEDLRSAIKDAAILSRD
jgi:CheY-like chemotaxis protein